MFVSYRHTYTFHMNGAGDPIGWKNRFVIVDDDFEETIETTGYFIDTFIDLYERRELRVGPNLFRALVYYMEHYTGGSGFSSSGWGGKRKLSQKDLDTFKQSNRNLAKYELEIQKYMVLL